MRVNSAELELLAAFNFAEMPAGVSESAMYAKTPTSRKPFQEAGRPLAGQRPSIETTSLPVAS